jgi:hypothetical protein
MLLFAMRLAAILGYLDPGSGSFLLQLAIAAIVGLAVVLRLQWTKIKKLFGRGQPAQDEEDDTEDDEQE